MLVKVVFMHIMYATNTELSCALMPDQVHVA